MISSVLLRHLNAFTPPERRGFRLWLASPFFNRRKDVCVLYDYIAANRNKHPERLQKEPAYAAVFPGQAFNDRQLNHVMSWLLDQVRAFLSWQEWQSDEAGVGLLHCRALRRRGLDDAFAAALEQTLENLEAQPWRDEHWHTLRHQLYREKYEQVTLQSRRRPTATEVPLAEMAMHAETAHQLNRLRYACSAEVLHTVSGKRLPPEPATPPAAAERPPTLELYENLVKALREPGDEPAFFRAKTLLETYWPQFRDSERRDLYLLALNFCIRKINSGQRQFMREAFDLYRSGLQNRALFENGFLSRFTYKNAITAGLALFEFDWVRQFLEDFKPYLHRRERHDVYTFNLATYYFRLPDYDEAMRLLRDADFGDDVLTNLDARAMLLRIYYERGYDDALESLLDSFQSYLRRRKDMGYQQENYLNLLRFTRKLLRLPPGDSVARGALRKEIETTPAVSERAWLMEQCGA